MQRLNGVVGFRIAEGSWHAAAVRVAQVLGLSLLMVFVSCLSLLAQGNAGRILGTITDQTGGAIAGANVTITDVARGTNRVLITDDAGSYNAPNLIPGNYTVKAEDKGFKTVERQNVILEVGGDLRVDLTLQPGEQTQTITVTEAIPLVNTTSAELGGTLQNETINNLPLNGRNFENLLTLRPGVTIYPGGGGWTQSTNGVRAHDNVYLVDGVNSNDPWMAQSMMNAGAAAGDADTILPIDAIDEFKTEINPRAEYGWKPGAVVNVGIKSGTNSVHGTAYAYGRSDAFDARDYFNPAPGLKSPLNFEQWGATVGGPIKKDKIFYFLNFEEQRYSVGSPASHHFPITAAGVADPNSSLAASNLIGACQAENTAGKLTALSAQLAGLSGPGSATPCTPLSNFPGLFPTNAGPTTTALLDVIGSNRIDAGLAKIDYHINDKNELHGSYFISPGNGLLVDDSANQINPLWLTAQYARTQIGSGNWTWTPNSTWVNEFRVGYSHYYQSFLSGDSAENPANYSFNGSTYHIFTGQTNPIYFGLPRIRIRSFSNFQLGASWPKIVGPDSNLQILDHISYLRGNHSFKFGGEVLILKNVSNVTANAKGPIRFGTLQSYFAGVPNQAAFLSGSLQRDMSSRGYAAFFQDDWRIKPRLTVNLGIRYEINTVPTEAHNLIGNFDPASPTGFVQGSTYNDDYRNFSPRLGLAWDVNGNGRTVIRAGGSLIYEQLSNDVFNNVANVLGLRSVPTGVALFANGQQIPNTGKINAAVTNYNGTAALTGGSPGDIAFDWQNNSSSLPIYRASPACGDGSVEFPAGTGFFPGPCSAVGVNPNLRTPYVTTWTLGIQRAITDNMSIEVAYVGDHGTKLVALNDANLAPVGAGWTPAAIAACLNPAALYQSCSSDPGAEQSARPFNTKFPYLQYIDIFSNRDYSNYNGLQTTLTQRTSHGLSFTFGYTYSHSLDIASDNWGTQHVPIQPNNNLLYASSDTDIRHRATLSLTYAFPGKKGFGQLLEGWSLNSIVTLQSGLPWWAQDTSNDFTGTGEVGQNGTTDGQGEQWSFFGNPADFTEIHGFTSFNGGALNGGGGLPYFGPNPNFDGVTNFDPSTNATCNAAARKLDGGAQTGLAQAALFTTGCFASPNGRSVLIPPAFGTLGNAGRNIWRDTGFKNWDLSITKSFKFKERLTAQFRAEAFNVLNHVTFANPYGGQGGGSTDNDPSAGAIFGCGCVTADTGGSNPVLGSGGPRAIQLGLKLIF